MKCLKISGKTAIEVDFTPEEEATFIADLEELNSINSAQSIIRQQDYADKQAVKLETQVQSFIAMTPAEVNTYIDNNVTDLASAKTVLKFFGRMLLILVRREYRD